MPEGHVIHRIADEINAAFAGWIVQTSSPQGRFAHQAAILNGSELHMAQACGKHLFIDFQVAEPATVHIHLGLIGKLRIKPLAEPTGVVRFRIANHRTAADLHGPQWCRLITCAERDAVIADSGPDPLRADSDPERGWARIKRSAKPIGTLLLDQRIAAGVGNIYRAEVLFRHRIDPYAPGEGLTHRTWQLIWDDLVMLMADGRASGRIDTVAAEHEPEVMGRPPRDDPHGGEVYVYRRAGQSCLVCGTLIRVANVSGRNLYWCPRCQRRRR